MKHFFIVALLVILGTLGVYAGLNGIGLLPEQASLQAVAVDKLFGLHVWLISFLFSLIVVTLLYSLVVFRRRKGETGDGAHIQGNTKLEIFWTMIPLFAVLVGAVVLGERMNWHQPVGALIVLFGVAVAQGLVGRRLPRAAVSPGTPATPAPEPARHG